MLPIRLLLRIVKLVVQRGYIDGVSEVGPLAQQITVDGDALDQRIDLLTAGELQVFNGLARDPGAEMLAADIEQDFGKNLFHEVDRENSRPQDVANAQTSQRLCRQGDITRKNAQAQTATGRDSSAGYAQILSGHVQRRHTVQMRRGPDFEYGTGFEVSRERR